ncbi:hypothetical protein [Streptomyces guryensis]|uniref:DUF5666 domain-containing protein n=1 Tax=Streptomyces guryensis TaxID=2886947 RepID=A0A9Q3VPU6_9ACTN|nr:hypothetical protein [Streptomyces guryensis]MCD9874865.1 hypothetical protein [Streptomyces guryensis]
MHEPDQEPSAGGEPPDGRFEPTADMEVMTGPGGPEREPARWRRRSRRARAVAAAATVAVLAIGGTVAYAATSGGSGQGAMPSASGSASPSPRGPGGRHGVGPWFGFGFGSLGVHGETTVKDQDTGKWVVRIWQRGTVEKVDGDQVTVKSDDGARWAWTVNSDTTVFRDGTKGSGAGDLKKGETALLAGTRSDNGTRTATRAVSGTFDHNGPGDRHGRFPGKGNRDWRHHAPSPSPSGSGATT